MVYPLMNQVDCLNSWPCVIYTLGVGHRITILQTLSGFFLDVPMYFKYWLISQLSSLCVQ